MKKKLLLNLVLFTILFTSYNTFGQLVLTQLLNGSEYAEKIVGQGIVFENASITGAADAIAYYTNGSLSNGTVPGMESGVILSTGSLATSDAMNGPSSVFKSTSIGNPGFTELSDLVNGEPTFDGIMLEFDFTPSTDVININFQFGSEEYNEWVETDYNDVFAFIITGPDTPPSGWNLATIPDYSTRLSSSVIHCGNNCPADDLTAPYCPYYIDNCSGVHANTCMDGFTIMLNRQVEVTPCQTYHVKLMLADITDSEYDSWVFIQESGFHTVGPIVKSEIVYANGNDAALEGCVHSELTFFIDEPLTYNYTFEIDVTGTAVAEDDYLELPYALTIPAGQTSVTIPIIAIQDFVDEGIETIIITYPSTECDDAVIEIFIDEPYICCFPSDYFDAPTGDSEQTLEQGQTLADLIISGYPDAYFVWYSDANLTIEIPETTEVTDNTTYYVIQEIEGCLSNALAIHVEVTLSNPDFDEKSFVAYPNPTYDALNISYSKEITNVEVTNMLGQLLISQNENSTDVKVDFSVLSAGNYLVKIKTDGISKTIKVVKH
ncbi:MAG: choice-of-anchor L domain-containing protein [Flavobacteriaceae bacterium]